MGLAYSICLWSRLLERFRVRLSCENVASYKKRRCKKAAMFKSRRPSTGTDNNGNYISDPPALGVEVGRMKVLLLRSHSTCGIVALCYSSQTTRQPCQEGKCAEYHSTCLSPTLGHNIPASAKPRPCSSHPALPSFCSSSSLQMTGGLPFSIVQSLGQSVPITPVAPH